jgi:hypothetical protein
MDNVAIRSKSLLQLLSDRDNKTIAAICELCDLLEAKGVNCFDILDRLIRLYNCTFSILYLSNVLDSLPSSLFFLRFFYYLVGYRFEKLRYSSTTYAYILLYLY